eukprot:410447-Pelagomonas_calceolata.AAC.5
MVQAEFHAETLSTPHCFTAEQPPLPEGVCSLPLLLNKQTLFLCLCRPVPTDQRGPSAGLAPKRSGLSAGLGPPRGSVPCADLAPPKESPPSTGLAPSKKSHGR